MALAGRSIGRVVQILAAAGISIGLGWYIWSLVDTTRLADMLTAVPPSMLAAMVVTYMLYQMLRAWRFRIIFPSTSRDYVGLVATVCVQGGIAVMLPLKLGEAVIIAFLRQRHGVRIGVAATGVFLAFVVDLLLHVALFIAAMAVYRDLIPNEVFRYAALLVAGATLLVLLATMALLTPQRLVTKLHGWASEQAALVATAVAEMLRRHVLVPFLATSILMWAAMFLFFHLMLTGLSVPGGIGSTWFVFSMLLPVRTIPLRGIADFGTHEAAWFFLLRLLGEGSGQAATTAFGSHALILLAVAVTFMIGLAGIGLGRLHAQASP